jgi:hypothetical protein
VTAYSLNANNSVFENATLVVGANGILECFGSYLECEGNVIPGSAVYVAVGGWAIPGLINTGAETGQSDVDSEISSQDGIANGANIRVCFFVDL